MDSHPNRSHRQPGERLSPDEPLRDARPVPITVWRLDDHDDGQSATEPGVGFASRLARRLVEVYTRRGETIIDVGHDHHLRNAVIAAGRGYQAVAEAAELPGSEQVGRSVSLLTMRWPPNANPSTADQIEALLTACRPVMAEGASVVAAMRPADPSDPGGNIADRERALRAVAEHAGFTHVLQIVAVSAPGERDEFLYYATAAEAAIATTATADRLVLHIDLLVFHPRWSR